MESKKARTIVTTTITTEPSSAEDTSNVDALQDKIGNLTQQILLLQAKTDQLAQIVARGQEYREPQACNSQSDPPAHGVSTVGGGVYLGLVRARDVVELSEPMLKELDDGLRAIASRLFPRTGRPDRFKEEGEAVAALLKKVSLTHDGFPTTGVDYFSLYRETYGRYQRAAWARYGYLNWISEPRTNALYYETFLQLVLFRGINLEEVP